jgi:Serpentine type 7TM GPCR chemoreceptor Srw
MTSSSIVGIDNVTATAMQSPPSVNFSYYTVKDKEEAILSTFNYWIQAVFIKLVPCFLLTVLTILLVVAMHDANVRRMKLKSQGRRDESDRAREHNRTTAMLLAVVGLFQLVELPHGVLTLCSIFVPNFHADVYWALGDVIDIMALLNNTINFFLYCTMSRLFRDQFVQTFFCCSQSSSASSPMVMRASSSVRRPNTAATASPPKKNDHGWTKLEAPTTLQVDKTTVDVNHGNGVDR